MDKATKSIDIVEKTVGGIVDVMKKANAAEIFAKLSKSLSCLGPVFMAVSCILSIVSIFLPQAESEEMKVIREGFEKVNTRLDGLKGAIEEINVIAQLSAAKTTVIPAFDSVDAMESELLIAQRRGTKEAWSYFQKRFQKEYRFAADKIFNAMYGSKWEADFRFDLLELMRQRFKCSPGVITRVCLVSMHTINRGIALEAAYLGSIKYPARVKILRKIWHVKLEDLRTRCGDLLNNCESDWEMYSRKAFKEFYDKSVYEMSNGGLAKGLYSALSTTAPNIKWGVFVADGRDFTRHSTMTTAHGGSHFILKHKENGKTTIVFILNDSKSLPTDTKAKMERLGRELEQDKCCYLSCQGKFYWGTTSVIFSHFKRDFPNAHVTAGHENEEPHFIAPEGHHLKYTFKKTYCLPDVRYVYIAE